MNSVPFDHPLEVAVLSAVGAFVLKWLYNLISKNHVITVKDCESIRALCSSNIKHQLSGNADDVDDVCSKIGQLENLISVMFEVQLLICGKLQIDCSAITKTLVNRGLVD